MHPIPDRLVPILRFLYDDRHPLQPPIESALLDRYIEELIELGLVAYMPHGGAVGTHSTLTLTPLGIHYCEQAA